MFIYDTMSLDVADFYNNGSSYSKCAFSILVELGTHDSIWTEYQVKMQQQTVG